MKLLKNTLEYLNYGIGSNNYNSELFEWNMQPGGLYDDNRRKIVTKPMIENKPQSLEKGDKMRIPGVLDYTGAKYPFKKLLYKTGSKIHIKKKNRGKFTDYCGGNVTQDCINRAKRSGNKTLIKRAIFAENARKWK